MIIIRVSLSSSRLLRIVRIVHVLLSRQDVVLLSVRLLEDGGAGRLTSTGLYLSQQLLMSVNWVLEIDPLCGTLIGQVITDF